MGGGLGGREDLSEGIRRPTLRLKPRLRLGQPGRIFRVRPVRRMGDPRHSGGRR